MPRVDLSGEECERLYLQGLSIQQISEHYGVHYATVYRRLVDQGTPLRGKSSQPRKEHVVDYSHPNRKADAQQRAIDMAALYKDGFTLKKIGMIYDLSVERIRQILNELEPGMTKRPGKAQPEAHPAPAPVDDELAAARHVLANPIDQSTDRLVKAARVLVASLTDRG